eukprot:1158818-Pelagomonas_calceolata.AAC.14
MIPPHCEWLLACLTSFLCRSRCTRRMMIPHAANGCWPDLVSLSIPVHAQEDDPSRCEWLLACLISSLQHASEAGMQGMTGGRAAVSEPWGPNTATATLSTRADISSSTGSRGAQQGSSRDAAHDGGVLWPPGTPSLWSSCNDHRTARQAAFLAAALRQLGAAAVQTLGSSLLLSPGGRAGAGSLGTAHTQQQGSWASPRPQVQAASAQQHGVQGGAQRGASSVRGGLARPACLVRSLEAMAGLLERGSACLGENGSAYRGNGGAAGDHGSTRLRNGAGGLWRHDVEGKSELKEAFVACVWGLGCGEVVATWVWRRLETCLVECEVVV